LKQLLTWDCLTVALGSLIDNNGNNSPIVINIAGKKMIMCRVIEDIKFCPDILVSIKEKQCGKPIALRQGFEKYGEEIAKRIFGFFFGVGYFFRWRKFLVMRLTDPMGTPHWVKWEKARKKI
jgi:hypothetical protein